MIIFKTENPLKTLNLLFSEFGLEQVPISNIQIKYFGENNKLKFEKMLKSKPELQILQGTSKQVISLFGLANLIEKKRNHSIKNKEVSKMVTTRLGLLEQFGSSIIHLTDIADQFFPFSYDVTVKKINSGELALNAFKMMSSQKAPFLVHIDDLVALMEERREDSRKALGEKVAVYKALKEPSC